jgi:Right handed beta helix region
LREPTNKIEVLPPFLPRIRNRPALTGAVGVLLFCLPAALTAPAATFYIDGQNGNDANDGLSQSRAWRTMDRANEPVYGPGDAILLKRGCVWQGTGFKAKGNGSEPLPIVLADYGDSTLPRPIIDGVGAHEPALLLQNVQNWIVRNLELTQHGQAPQNLDPNNEKGKDADQYSDEYMRAVVHVLGLGPPGDPNCGEDCTVRNIRLENLLVRDGSWTGIYASGGYYQLRSDRFGGLDNLVIAGVESRHNHKAGIEVTCTYYKTRIYAASNLWVLDSHLHDNGGDGVMVGPVQNAWLEGNECDHNGRLRNARVGCWTWDSENTTIQFNESHHNMTPLTDGKARDGSGFDLDLGTENGMIQYNWSHDNEGEGFLLLSWPVGYGYSRGESHYLQMRYNVSERDGKKLGGGITVFGGVSPAVIYNNVIYYEPDRLAGTEMFNGEGGAVTSSIFGKSGKPDLSVYNNIFVINGRTNPAAFANALWTDGAGTFTFDNNLWWRVEGGVRFQWANAAITSWSGWQANGFDSNSFNANPALLGPLGAGPGAYLLGAGSLARDQGRVVADALRGMGTQDAFGAWVPQGAAYDVGAAEFRLILPDPAAARLSGIEGQIEGWRLQFSGLAGRSYRVETSADFKVWSKSGVATEASPGLFEFTDPGVGATRFYRAVARGVPGS